MLSPKDDYKRQAAAWDAAGRPDELLLKAWKLFALSCWVHSKGGKVDGASATLAGYLAAGGRAEAPDWFHECMELKDYCSRCSDGYSYRAENMQLCTRCPRATCPGCSSQPPFAANGNTACPCGGEMVG